MLFGLHEDAAPATTAAALPGHAATRLFVTGIIGPRDMAEQLRRDCGPTWKANQTAVWSFKPRPTDVTNKRWRKPLEDLAHYLKTYPDRRTIVVIWHEPENDFPTPGPFVRMFNTCHEWMKGVWPGVTTAHAALAYRYQDLRGRGITSTVARQWRTNADINTVDIYSGRSNRLATILPELPTFNRWYANVAVPGRWGVTERGWTCAPQDSQLRADTITREFAWLASQPATQRPDPYLIWSTVGTEKDGGLVLDKPALGAVAAGFAKLSRDQSASGSSASGH